MKLRDLLKIKNRQLITIAPGETIYTAIQKLVEHDRGSLPVCNDKGELVGIITERDIVRKSLTRSEGVTGVRVRDVMTGQVAIGFPDDELDYAISVMKQKRIRHLPVVENQKVLGMISMRDLLDVQLSETRAEVRYSGLLRKHIERPIV